MAGLSKSIQIILVIYSLIVTFLFLHMRSNEVINSDKFSRTRNHIKSMSETKLNLPKILYCIACSSFNRIDVVEMLLDSVQDWCEAGYSISVIIDTYDATVNIDSLEVAFREKASCLQSFVDVKIILHNYKSHMHSINNLGIFHRRHFKRNLNKFDLFIYGEDDMNIRLSTINRWIFETNKLKNLSLTHHIGLVRDENAKLLSRNRNSMKNIARLSPNFTFFASVGGNNAHGIQSLLPVNRITWEFNLSNLYLVTQRNHPDIVSVGIRDNEYFSFDMNQTLPYAAASIFYRYQLAAMESSCLFLSQHNIEYQLTPPMLMLEFYASSQPYYCGPVEYAFGSEVFNVSSPELFCCRQWLLPTNRFESLFIHHIGTPGEKADNKWANRHKIHGSAFLYTWKKRVQHLLKSRR